jgi:DNA-binding protein HU-beta
MNTAELVAKIADAHGVSKAQAKSIVDDIFKDIVDAAASGAEVSLPGFGKFKVKATPEREGRNPANGEKIMCGRIWTPPDCNSRLDWDRWSQLLTYIRLRDAAGQRLRREPRWVFARFHLKAPMTLERHAGPHIRFGKRRSDRFAISCHLLQLPGRDLLSLFAASVHAAFTDSAGS